MPIFFGFTGLPGSGKGQLIRRVENGCQKLEISCRVFSLSDELREITRSRGLPVERPILKKVANELRKEMGSSALAQVAYHKVVDHVENAEDVQGAVLIDAIRTPGEVEFFRKKLKASQFFMVAITADLDVISERLRDRARQDEAADVVGSAEKTRQLLDEESGLGQPSFGLNISGSIAAADLRYDNTGDLLCLNDFANHLVSIIQDLSHKITSEQPPKDQ